MNRVPNIVEEICCMQNKVDVRTLEQVLLLAMEIAREGREGRKIGTIFVVGDAENVLQASRPLILDPLSGHPDEAKRIDDPDLRETVKELAQLDGGFIVSDAGVVLSAARYFHSTPEGIEIPMGLGTRHMAGASITRKTRAIAVVVSESSMVRLFENGKVLSEISPEVWMLRRHGLLRRDGERSPDCEKEEATESRGEPTG